MLQCHRITLYLHLCIPRYHDSHPSPLYTVLRPREPNYSHLCSIGVCHDIRGIHTPHVLQKTGPRLHLRTFHQGRPPINHVWTLLHRPASQLYWPSSLLDRLHTRAYGSGILVVRGRVLEYCDWSHRRRSIGGVVYLPYHFPRRSNREGGHHHAERVWRFVGSMGTPYAIQVFAIYLVIGCTARSSRTRQSLESLCIRYIAKFFFFLY